MELFISIGKRLREVREGMALSQSEFAGIAESAGVPGATRQSQARYEKGEQMPGVAYLAAIAEAGADVFYVLTGQAIVSRQQPAPLTEEGIEAIVKYKLQAGQDVRPYGLSDDENVLIERYRSSSSEVRAAALRMLSAPTEPPPLIKPPKRLTERDSDLPEKRFKKPEPRGKT